MIQTTTLPLIMGNWKQNTSRQGAVELASAVAQDDVDGATRVVIPPFPWLLPVAERIDGSGVLLGAQTCSAYDDGAHTGEVSASMLTGLCQYVLVGHSERRARFGETDTVVAEKMLRVVEAGLTPVLCVGETLAERERGEAEAIVGGQLAAAEAALSADDWRNVIVAYEPVWAIGTGVSATADDAKAMGAFIASRTSSAREGGLPVLYGGSVSAANAAELWAVGNLAGFLVGGASLKAADFNAIARAAAPV